MPMVNEHAAVHPAVLADPARGWRRMLRVDTVGGNVNVVIDAIRELLPEKLVYAEGDSWFDKFTPIPMSGTNLLDAIRTPFLTAVVDVAHIGDEARDMVRGHQARQTKAMFNLFDFGAILLSAGGNDLKNVFADLFAAKAMADEGVASPFQPQDLDRLATPSTFTEFFAEVVRNIGRFVDLRNAARSAVTRQAPIFLHGYDYLQPRPAGATIFAGSRIGRGPWLHPALVAAGLDDAQMRSTADAIVDELNRQLAAVIAPLDNVHVIDSRGLLIPAAAGSTGDDADWLDEIHPNAAGFTKLARNRWDVPLSRALGWQPQPGELVAPLPATNQSTAQRDDGDAPQMA
jgi:lysophospholipase L1-like esterase